MKDAESNLNRGRTVSRWSLAVIYFIVGLFHFYLADALLQIVPDWVPYPRHVVLFTGICEIIGAIALLTKSLRRAAGIAFALYALCVWPANIKQAIEGIPLGEMQVGWWYHAPRLAFQPVLIWWALFAGELITWPFGRRVDPSNGEAK
jgi:uncharacterized membrane protein